MTNKQVETINNLTKSVQNLAEIVNTLIDSMVDTTSELKTLQEDYISLCNRINELELNKERKELTIQPFVDRRRKSILVETPYPQPHGRIRKIADNLKRLVRASS